MRRETIRPRMRVAETDQARDLRRDASRAPSL